MTAFHWFAFAAFLASFGFSAYGIQGTTKSVRLVLARYQEAKVS